MSKKILAISVVVIAVGTGLVPSGILIEDYINDLVYDSVDEGLLGIEEDAIPLIEPMIKEMAIPQVLRGIRDSGIPIIEEMVNVTFVAVLIETFAITGGDVFGSFQDPMGMENFFNNDTKEGGSWLKLDVFNGTSRHFREILNFTEDAQNRILYGNSTSVPGYIPGIQGFLNDTSTGSGVANFLEQYYTVNSSGSSLLNQTMQENFNCTWYQLTKLYEYVTDFLIYYIIPQVIALNLHVEYMPALGGLLSTTAIAYAMILEQWANGTILGESIYEGGIDFSELLEDINETLIGFEVGRLNPSNITRKIAYALFDEINYTNALTNDIGIEQWISAYSNDTIKNSLVNEFNLTQSQMDMILYWLFEESFQENVVPELMKLPPPDGVGMNITEYARVLLLEQWANGTAHGRALYPYGFPLPLKGGIKYGLEVGYQGIGLPVLPTNMSLESAESLWDISNEYSLVNKTGMRRWYEAVKDPDSTLADNLQINNFLEDGAMEMILEWIPEFRANLMPYLAQHEYDLPMDSKSLANAIELGMAIPGGILIGLGVLGIARNILIKRKIE